VSAELILRARAGETAALEALIVSRQQQMGRFVVSQLGTRDDALDVCQVVFVKMVRGLPKLASIEGFEPWLYQIARNACSDHLRRKRREAQVFIPLSEIHAEVSDPPTPDSRADERIGAALEQLAPSHRRVVDLSLEKSRTYEELARLTHVSVPAVRNRLFRARERLRQLLLGPKERP
jgi:RNA polymerase sigma-70 factor (ECF subfamily)